MHYGNFIVLILFYFIFYFAAKERYETIYKINPVKKTASKGLCVMGSLIFKRWEEYFCW